MILMQDGDVGCHGHVRYGKAIAGSHGVSPLAYVLCAALSVVFCASVFTQDEKQKSFPGDWMKFVEARMIPKAMTDDQKTRVHALLQVVEQESKFLAGKTVWNTKLGDADVFQSLDRLTNSLREMACIDSTEVVVEFLYHTPRHDLVRQASIGALAPLKGRSAGDLPAYCRALVFPYPEEEFLGSGQRYWLTGKQARFMVATIVWGLTGRQWVFGQSQQILRAAEDTPREWALQALSQWKESGQPNFSEELLARCKLALGDGDRGEGKKSPERATEVAEQSGAGQTSANAPAGAAQRNGKALADQPRGPVNAPPNEPRPTPPNSAAPSPNTPAPGETLALFAAGMLLATLLVFIIWFARRSRGGDGRRPGGSPPAAT